MIPDHASATSIAAFGHGAWFTNMELAVMMVN